MILPQTIEDVAVPIAGNGISAGYVICDELMLWLSVGLTVLVVVGWILRGRHDPLRSAPDRPHQITQEVVFLVMLGYLAAGLLLSSGFRAAGGDPEDGLASVLLGSVAQLIGLAISLWLLAGRFASGMRRFWLGPTDPSPTSQWCTLLATLVLAVGLCPLLLEVTVNLVEYVAPAHEFATHPTVQMLHQQPARPMIVALLWIGAAVVAPLAEEVFFRGLLQTYLTKVLGGRWSAIFAVSIAFGVVHFGQPHAIPALLLLSVLIGFAYERTGSLAVAAAIHGLFNLKTLVWDASLG